MAISHYPAAIAASLMLLIASGCTTYSQTGRQELPKGGGGTGAGAAVGGGAEALVGGRRNRAGMILGTGIAALPAGAIGPYMDRQERELRANITGTDVKMVRRGDVLTLTMPTGIAFATNGREIQPRFRRTLDQVANTLSRYSQTYIDVYGHTDSTGTDAINIPLSENRAAAVAGYLEGKGVQTARIGMRGLGASEPVVSNDTPEGRQANRRVEIRIVPVTDQDA